MNSGQAGTRIALVISDVDGTLLDNEKQLTSGAPAAVQRLYDAGIRFTIASARPPRMIRELVRMLKIREPLACFNGALFVSPDETVLHKFPMSTADAQAVADYIVQRKFDLWVWTDNDWYVSNPAGPHVARHERQMGRKATPLFGHDMSRFDVLKLVGVCDDHDAIAKAEAEMVELGTRSISGTRSSPYYLDVTDARANKGEAVLTISQMLQIPTQQIATIGDMSTDALMFHKSGISIAMGNALDDVKAQAKYVTRTNEENGFAYAMDHYVPGLAEQRLAAD
ncbi:MAG TPA: HAD family hydrolase [Candidatus Eisenbacteria bacterium]|nr:HAD family hydrolase [Candidatus Eisenbacteria bacterium]